MVVGVGQVWGDFDADGYEDLYVLTPGAEDRLFENVGDGTFLDVTEASGLGGLVSRDARWGDADGDGAMDLLLVSASGGLRLYRGVQSSLFEDCTRAASLESEQGVLAAGWLDYDHDGHLDLKLETTAGSRLLHSARGRFEAVVLGGVPLPPLVPSVTPGAPLPSSEPAPASDPLPNDPREPDRRHGDHDRTPPGRVSPSSSPATESTNPVLPGVPMSVVNCIQTLEDQASLGTCIEGSSVPTLGRFYPMTALLNVNSTTGNVGIGTTTPSARLSVSEGGAVTDVARFFASNAATTKLGLLVEHANSAHTFDSFSIAALYRRSAVVSNDNTLMFDMNDSAGNRQNLARIGVSLENASPGAVSGSIGFWVVENGNAPARRMTIQPDGKVGINTTAPAAELDVSGRIRTTDFTMTAGAVNGRVLTSDGTGQGSWQALAGVPSGFMISGFTATAPSGFTFTGLTQYAGDHVWSSVASLGQLTWGCAAGTASNFVYVMGGHVGGPPSPPITDETFRYDPKTNNWTKVDNMTTPRRFFASASLGGFVYAIGGESSTQGLDTAERYDPAQDSWKSVKSMSALRFEFSAGALNGKIYAVAGRGPGGGDVALNEEYDPVSDSWTTRAPLPVVKRNAGVVGLNAKLYVIGGRNSATVHEYNPATNTWAQKASMGTVREAAGVAAVGGRIYAIGGLDASANSIATVEEYNPVENTWTFVPSMTVKRGRLGTTDLNGHIYAIGGDQVPGGTSKVEELLPQVQVFLHQKN